MPQPKFEVVEDDEPDSTAESSVAGGLAVSATLLALKALSQRAVAAASYWFTLLTLSGAWYLWWSIPDPSPTQIISLSIFAVFILAANWLIRRK